MKRVLIVNGPNLNLLGTREPEIYGATTLNELEGLIAGWGRERGVAVTCFQSNHEGELIDRLHDSRHAHDGVIINAGALTHYSYALHDAIVAIGLPTVEVHISNIKEREGWRRTSVIEPACVYMIRGRGIDGYRYALDHLVNQAVAVPETVSYGPAADQVGDLLVPDGAGPHPVAVLIHGGFWRDRWTRDIMAALALDLLPRGWATWNLEYHRVGTGGGWPMTLEDVAAGIDHLAALAPGRGLDLGRVVAIGHSAGGQLALWAAARPHLSDSIPNIEKKVSLHAVAGLAPVSDLVSGFEMGIGSGAVEDLLRRMPEDGPKRYRAASPRQLLPLGVPQLVVHGTEDDAVPVDMSRAYTAAATAAGDNVVYKELDGVDHMALIDPAETAWNEVRRFLAGLL
ncbi:MAG: type II 3-dehydroquinate dehydratase [Acidimicrobiia bacterium]|nr:type II 3-dehydroquinate dehydratase [Acidimicrobiia bacterium]